VLDGWPAEQLPKTIVRVAAGETGSPVAGNVAAAGVVWPAGAIPFAEVLAHPPLPAAPAERKRSDLAYILYTSGSTGVPKGVMLTQENALSFVDWCSEVFAPDASDRFSSHAPFHFDLSVLDLYLPVKHGATLFIISEELGKDPKALSRFAADKKLTIWYSTPSVL